MTLRNQPSPTCVVEFTDGEIVRMTTWSVNGKPNLRRGIKLAHSAYESRKRVARLRKQKGSAELSGDLPELEKCELPAITALHFETADGASVTTANFTAEQIAEDTHDQ